MAQAAAQRHWQALHERDGQPMWHDGTFTDWVAERDAAHPYSRDEGVTIVVGEVDDGTWDALVGGAPEGGSEEPSAVDPPAA